MTDPRALADSYLAVWNEEDDGRRRSLLADGWTEDARYADPMMAGRGPEDIAAMIERARARFPGHHFSLAGTPDGHGAHVRFSWTLAPKAGAVLARGTDVVTLSGLGRIHEVVGFFDGDQV